MRIPNYRSTLLYQEQPDLPEQEDPDPSTRLTAEEFLPRSLPQPLPKDRDLPPDQHQNLRRALNRLPPLRKGTASRRK